ncbi:MAG: hypothetical protein IPM48_02185 [Saprospiraceae bacterium]|nr:hypothetical protein [Saprospiraceae bacterium]
MKENKKSKTDQKKGKVVKFEPSNDQEIGLFVEEILLNHEEDFKEDCFFEDIIEAGRVLWNLATLRKFHPKLFLDLLPEVELELAEIGLVKSKIQEILKLKETKYSRGIYLADEVEMLDPENSSAPTIKVNLIKTENFAEFLKSSVIEYPELYMFFGIEDEDAYDGSEYMEDEDDSIPGYMDRFNLVLMPRPNFVLWAEKWLNENNKKSLLEAKSFAISSDWDQTPMDDLIETYYQKMMEVILMRITEKKNWPKKLSLSLFYDWFECHKTEVTYDLESDMVLKFGEGYPDDFDFDASLN